MNLLASDYDGTLNGCGITDGLRDAIRAWRAQGNLFGVVSGRCPPALVSKLAGDGIETDFLVAGNGTFLIDGKGETLWSLPLPDADADALLALLTDYAPVQITVSTAEVVTPVSDLSYTREPDGLHMGGMVFPLLYQLTPSFATTECTEEVCAIINSRLKGRIKAMMPSPFTFDAVSVHAGKAAGIRRLTERMGLHPERIYTVGDSKNDLDMLTAPDFIGTAMETSMQSVLDQVACTTPSVEALIRRLL